MWLAWLCTMAAPATELAFSFTTSEGVDRQWTKDHKEAWTEQFGPVLGKGKRRVKYDVTVMPSVFDPLDNAFQTTVSFCRYWSKKSDRDRDCVEELLLIPSKAAGPATFAGKVKGSDKFEFTMLAMYTGKPEAAVGLPGDPQPEVEEAEAEVVAEEEAVEEGPKKDEMASALEDIASGILSDLGDDEGADDADESDDDEGDDDE